MRIQFTNLLCVLLFALLFSQATLAIRPGECEVCNTFLGKIIEGIPEADKTNYDAVDSYFRKVCKKADDKDKRFVCFLIFLFYFISYF